MTDLTTLTPVEIDTFLSDNWEARFRTSHWLYTTHQSIDRERAKHVKRYGNDDDFPGEYGYSADLVKHAARYEADLAALRDAARPYEAEYARRPWLRYFLVRNHGGHVHRGMDCSTCYPTTEYGWLVDLADCDENAMVEEYGTMACTICFPDAPTLPAWKRHEETDAAREAEKAAKVCPGTGSWSAHYGRLRYEECETCGAYVAITRGGKFRKHDRKDAT